MSTDNKKYVGDSLFNHIRYKLWIWRKLFPLLFHRLGFPYFNDFISYNSSSNTMFNNKTYLKNLFTEKINISQGKYSQVIEDIENSIIEVDEMCDSLSGQRLIHLAVIYDERILTDYLIANSANLMARDYLGYTPLLKAAALGRIEIFKKLIDAGVPLEHYDPKMKSVRSRAELFNQDLITIYINQLGNDKINHEKYEYWMNKGLKERYKTSVLFHKTLY